MTNEIVYSTDYTTYLSNGVLRTSCCHEPIEADYRRCPRCSNCVYVSQNIVKKVPVKKCPFCGGKAIVEECGKDYDKKRVCCTNCQARGPIESKDHTAIKSWNEAKR